MIFYGALSAAFLLGAIPTGLLVSRLRGIDVRSHGSGNVGATNVYRVMGKLPGIFVLAVDVLKGWFPVAVVAPWAMSWGAPVSGETLAILLGVLAVAGHIWNPFLNFKGGKGVATAIGVLWGLDPRLGVAGLAVFVLVLFFTRYVSAASITAALVAPFLMLFSGSPTVWIAGGAAISLAIIFRHRPNILRLLHGEESKIGSHVR